MKGKRYKKKKPFTNGWLMVLEPSGHVVTVRQQITPENNVDVANAFAEVMLPTSSNQIGYRSSATDYMCAVDR
jgi:hypothetical protein